jgi:hypothetical protein
MDVNQLMQNAPILIVALITWGGVLAYLFRLEMLTRTLEKQSELAREQRVASDEDEL